MAELRLIGVSEDGERLVFADADGTEHTIVIDERLRAGVNGHLSRLGQLTMALESHISPREIQNRVRSGESAEHVAQTAAVPLERVLRFVGPVLREREHVAEQAKRARLAGSSGPTSLLGDLVGRAAARRGLDPDDVVWDSARRDDHTWVVTTAWPDDDGVAMWGLDLSRHQATPLDALARRVSGTPDGAPSDGSDSNDSDSNDEADFPNIADSPGFARFDAAESARPSPETDAKVHRFVPRAVPDAVDEPEPVDVVQPEAEEEPAAEPAPDETPLRHQPGRSARRAKVPKWDDIMFGMKPKDGP
jgi:hypothetical protein